MLFPSVYSQYLKYFVKDNLFMSKVQAEFTGEPASLLNTGLYKMMEIIAKSEQDLEERVFHLKSITKNKQSKFDTHNHNIIRLWTITFPK